MLPSTGLHFPARSLPFPIVKLDNKSFGCGILVGGGLGFLLAAGLVGLAWLALWTVRSERTSGAPLIDQVPTPADGDASVTEILQRIRREHDMPAMAAAIVTSDGVQRLGVVGFRKRGEGVPVTAHDSWHLGSDTKAMTSTLIARLVERGDLDWDTTMEAVFPELAEKFDPSMRVVTVEQLLAHRAGLPRNLDLHRYGGLDVRAERLRAVKEYLGQPPPHPPGEHYEYSNLGYIIAGAVIERIADRTWEEEMDRELFEPLEMSSAGFGGLGTPGQIDQPWAHRGDGTPMPANGPEVDNPPVMGPAGRVHCTIQDWAKFVRDQLRGARGEPDTLLDPASYKKLHTPWPGGEYALGWGVAERAWGGGTVLQHSGDNTMNHANVWIAPQRDFAILACANQGGDDAFKATDDAVGALVRLAAQLNLGSADAD